MSVYFKYLTILFMFINILHMNDDFEGQFYDGSMPDPETEIVQIEALLNFFTNANADGEIYLSFIEFVVDYFDLSSVDEEDLDMNDKYIGVYELCWAWESAYNIDELKDSKSLSVLLWVVKTNIPEVWDGIWNEYIISN